MIIFSSLSLLLAIALLTISLQHRKSIAKLKQQVKALINEVEDYQEKHRLVVNADLGFVKEIAEINRMLISMDKQLQSLENKRDNDGGYQHALRILEMGGDKEEIISNCHLSNAEAELLMNLNAYRAVMKTNSKITAE
mgnify:CR=1 FL=1